MKLYSEVKNNFKNSIYRMISFVTYSIKFTKLDVSNINYKEKYKFFLDYVKIRIAFSFFTCMYPLIYPISMSIAFIIRIHFIF